MGPADGPVDALPATAVEHSRPYSERSLVAELRRGLLPERVPDIPGFALASLYVPAMSGSEVGGEFYDAWEVDGRWFIVIGDVVGNGVAAASMTSLVRHTLRAASEYETSPAKLLATSTVRSRIAPSVSMCTTLCVRLNADRAMLAVGGHPLPLYLGAAGVRELDRGGRLRGALPDTVWSDFTVTLEPTAR